MDVAAQAPVRTSTGRTRTARSVAPRSVPTTVASGSYNAGTVASPNRSIASLTDGQKKDYSHPNELWKRHPESAQVFADTMAAVFTRNEKPVADAFRAAAQQINGINAAS